MKSIALYLISFGFLMWVCLSTVYIFDLWPKNKWLYRFFRFGWINRWNMFVPNPQKEGAAYKILYRDKMADNRIEPWQEAEEYGWHPTIFLINLQSRIDKIYLLTLRRVLKLKASGSKDIKHDPMFQYMCKILCDSVTSDLSTQRQVKLQYIHKDHQIEDIVVSDFIELK